MSGHTSRWSREYILYASTIFLSAFLLFVVQPMAGKHLLPWFGGSSSVWATGLLFFTGMLFVGYLYVYLLTKHGGRQQAYIHGVVVLLSVLSAVVGSGASLEWTIGDQSPPAQNVLIALFLMIGAPYFLLSTTGPLMQYWYGLSAASVADTQAGEPYKLYALSNMASFLALIGYVFIVEPVVPLPASESMWLNFFAIYAVLALVVCFSFSRKNIRASGEEDQPLHISTVRVVKWIALAAFPSLMLVATTTTITQTIAPVPLLWIVPLMIYLITLIVAFAGMGQSKFLPLMVLVSLYIVYSYLGYSASYLTNMIAADLAFLFFASLMCHAWLYRSRPPIAGLPLFYVYLSLGGALGVLVGSMVMPFIFADFWELYLCMAIAAALAIWVLSEDFFPRILDERNIMLTKIAGVLLAFTLFFTFVLNDTGAPFVASRNFYGAVKVRFQDQNTVLMHGTTIHGFQSRLKEYEAIPNSYYVPGSGIARAIAYAEKQRDKEVVDVGILGLGAGSISAYCRPGDTYVFYEIDPRIADIARNVFSYLQRCEGAEVRFGDGRMLLEKERREGDVKKYDVIAADAFTDDTIPAHLLTQQAVALYMAHARSDQSIIAIHTSNRYLRLAPVVLKIAASLGLTAKIIGHDGGESGLGHASQWVVLAKDPNVFEDIAFANTDFTLPDMRTVPLWTDDYTSLFSVYNW